MLTIALLISIAWIMSTVTLRRAVPFESILGFGVAGVLLFTLLLSGRF